MTLLNGGVGRTLVIPIQIKIRILVSSGNKEL